MATRLSNPIIQHFNKVTNAPLSGGQLFFYEPDTTTPKATYTDEAAGTANANPVILDQQGFEPNIFGSGSYRVILKSSVTAGSLQQFDRDPVLMGSDIDGAFSEWLSTTDYDVGEQNIVTASDGNYYVSIQTPNLDKDPTSQAAYWTEFDLLKRWNTNETYAIDDPVTHSGLMYISLTSNTAQTPASNPDDWELQGTKVTVQTFTSSGTWTKPDGVDYIIVEVIGGGGGGGGNVNGGGGGGGGYSRVVLDASALTSETVTIGTGGAGGPSGDLVPGDTGGTTSFGSLCVATGGVGGAHHNAVASSSLGGIGTTGDMLSAGGAGTPNVVFQNDGSAGGNTSFGAGGAINAGISIGSAGRDFGGGGGGDTGSTLGGGAGAPGFVFVTEFY